MNPQHQEALNPAQGEVFERAFFRRNQGLKESALSLLTAAVSTTPPKTLILDAALPLKAIRFCAHYLTCATIEDTGARLKDWGIRSAFDRPSILPVDDASMFLARLCQLRILDSNEVRASIWARGREEYNRKLDEAFSRALAKSDNTD